MLDANKPAFEKALFDLMRSYPTFRVSEKERDRIADAYFTRLYRYKLRFVVEAIDSAVNHHPERFPSAGQLIFIIKRVMAEHQSTTRSTTRTEMTDAEKEEARIARSRLPSDPQQQSEYVSSAETEAERIARMWEIEDMIASDPGSETPRDTAKDRFSSLLALIRPMTDKEIP